MKRPQTMPRSVLLWIIAFFVTVGTAYVQRVTGPTYPLSGRFSLGEHEGSYRLLQSWESGSDAPVAVVVGDSSALGRVLWRRVPSDDEWDSIPMIRHGDTLTSWLPGQPPAGKVEYCVAIVAGDQRLMLPEERFAVMRFKGAIRAPVLIIHIVLIFIAMLLSTRAGLSLWDPKGMSAPLAAWTLGTMFMGGLVLGPIVQKEAFGAYWTGWPLGTDLTDNKTLLAFLAWVGAAFALKRNAKPEMWAAAAAVVTLLVFLIPHSMFGSEIDYRKEGKRDGKIVAAPREPSRNASSMSPGETQSFAFHPAPSDQSPSSSVSSGTRTNALLTGGGIGT